MNNREIKFRGLRIDSKGWVYGYYWIIKEHFTPTLSGIDYIKSINNGIDYEVVPSSVGRFTGLRDVKGTDIYEGDVLKETRLNGIELYYKVFYKKGGLVINTHQDDFNKPIEHIVFYESIADMQNSGFIETLEVVGNIHEYELIT